MSGLLQIDKMKLVKTWTGLKDQLERWGAARYHGASVARLRCFREELECDMHPEPWINLTAPMVAMLADVCDALELDEGEKATVLGAKGRLALADTLETRIRPFASPGLPANERQVAAMRYLREHGEINLSTYREICPFWSDETLRLDLADLVNRKVLVKNGNKRGTLYKLVA
jgi:hypothetical protein